MNKIKIMCKTLIPIIFCLMFTTTAFAQFSNEAILKVKITNNLPVGWGYRNKATVLEVIDGNRFLFDKEIEFGLVAGHYCEDLQVDDIVIIYLSNTKEKSPQPYLPACNCTVIRKNQIWEIIKVKRVD